MELKEFIKTALSDITNAVSELQAELQNGAIVSPSVSIPVVLPNTHVKNRAEWNEKFKPKRPDYPVNQNTNDQ